MKRLTPQEKQDQLNILKRWIEKYTAEHPRNEGEYSWGMRENNLNAIQKPLRDGIVFYSNGWGWRLRKNWREALAAAEQAVQAELLSSQNQSGHVDGPQPT